MRAVLILIGVAMGVYGAVLLWEFPLETIVRIGVWAVAGAIVHDFVFAPLSAAAGLAGRRLFRGRWWSPVSMAGLCTAVLLLIAIPVYTKPGEHQDNTTVLDRDYHLGLWIALAVVWACVPIYWALARLLPVGHDEAVDGERPGHVESKPPAV